MRQPEHHAAPRIHQAVARSGHRYLGSGISGQERQHAGQRQQRDVRGWKEAVRRRFESGSAGERSEEAIGGPMKRFVTAIVLAAVPLAAQTAKPAAAKSIKAYTAPKTPWGDPDLQGQWPATANIPMQRPQD